MKKQNICEFAKFFTNLNTTMLYLPTGLKCTLRFYEQEALKVISTDEHKITVNKHI